MIIYKATNKDTGEVYVGQSEKSLVRQKEEHLSASESGSKSSFHKALREYGSKAFTWEVLDECKNKEEADKLETYYIGVYDSYVSGYNSTLGAEATEIRKERGCLGNPISYRLQKELEDVLIAVATANNLSPGAFSRQCVKSVLENIEYTGEKKEDKKIDYGRFIGLYVSSFLYTMLNVLAEAKNKKMISLVREVLENYIKTELEIK